MIARRRRPPCVPCSQRPKPTARGRTSYRAGPCAVPQYGPHDRDSTSGSAPARLPDRSLEALPRHHDRGRRGAGGGPGLVAGDAGGAAPQRPHAGRGGSRSAVLRRGPAPGQPGASPAGGSEPVRRRLVAGLRREAHAQPQDDRGARLRSERPHRVRQQPGADRHAAVRLGGPDAGAAGASSHTPRGLAALPPRQALHRPGAGHPRPRRRAAGRHRGRAGFRLPAPRADPGAVVDHRRDRAAVAGVPGGVAAAHPPGGAGRLRGPPDPPSEPPLPGRRRQGGAQPARSLRLGRGAHPHRPGPLQDRQRHARPPHRRPAAARRGRSTAGARSAAATTWPGREATSSCCCCRGPTGRRRTPRPRACPRPRPARGRSAATACAPTPASASPSSPTTATASTRCCSTRRSPCTAPSPPRSRSSSTAPT